MHFLKQIIMKGNAINVIFLSFFTIPKYETTTLFALRRNKEMENLKVLKECLIWFIAVDDVK